MKRGTRGDKAKGDMQTEFSAGKAIISDRSLFTDFFVLCLLK
jgi:hypothetical protein